MITCEKEIMAYIHFNLGYILPELQTELHYVMKPQTVTAHI